MKPVQCAISYVIHDKEGTKMLIVKRPEDDEDLPGLWGLPAGTVHDDESFEDAVVRSGSEKLGVLLDAVRFIGRGDIERDEYILHMELYEAKIAEGEPEVPQPVEGVTQYQKWRWGIPDDMKEAASKGSLCSRICLENLTTAHRSSPPG